MTVVYAVLASLFIGISGSLIVSGLLDRDSVKDQGRIRPDRAAYMKSPVYRLFVQTAGFLMSIHPKRDRLSGYFIRLKKRLLLAGEPLCITPEEFLALKELAAFCCVVISLAIGFTMSIALVLCVAGFFYPDLWLRELYKKRRVTILKELPYILDLLTLSIEAGLDLTGSVSRVVEKSKKGIMHTELFHFLQELKMGKARKQALADMAGRMGVPEITSLVNAIIQSDELGSGLGRTLRIQSQEYRTRRFHRAEKLAMEAPVKMTFPLLFIFISVFLLLFGSFAIQAMRGKLF